MSGTGTSTGDFDDDQKGFTTEPDPSASVGAVFAEVAGATAMPEEVPSGSGQPDIADGTATPDDDDTDDNDTDDGDRTGS